MTKKQDLYKQCLDFIDNRLETVKKAILEIEESLMAETKSSAGDKHETGRAMLQLEREKAGNQLAEIGKVKKALAKIDIEKQSSVIGLGSLVLTSQANYFIAISAGELKMKDQIVYAISPNTAIGQLLVGKTVGDKVFFRDKEIKIFEVI